MYRVFDVTGIETRRKAVRRELEITVHVSPDATRQVVAGDDGLSYLVIGAAPGGYDVREPF